MAGKRSSANHFDLILIGSGMGALTVASLMAQLRGKKVLVLEQHFALGGYTQDFRRGRFRWDVGLHYVGQMQENSLWRRLFDLVTKGRVQWARMPEPFEKFVYPDFRFDVHGGKRFVEDLCAQFSEEAASIRRYFRDVRKAWTGMAMAVMRRDASPLIRTLGAFVPLFVKSTFALTTRTYLQSHFKNPVLKALLASQWGDYGLPPGLSPFGLHAVIVNHFFGGGYYPTGGAGTIAKSAKPIVESRGGRCMVSREVTEILIRHGRAVGVKVRNPSFGKKRNVEEFFAPVIVSNAGTINTYLKLIPPEEPIPFRRAIYQFVKENPPSTNLSLFLGLSRDPRTLGFQGENHWIYGQLNHDEIFAGRAGWLKKGEPSHAFLSFPSLKDPKAEAHTAEIISFTDYKSFAKWRSMPWKKRGEDYSALKERATDALISFVDRHYPGFAALIEYKELATPLSNESLAGHYGGATYGLSSVASRFQTENLAWTHPRTPVPGLYMTGADVAGFGIVYSMVGGIICLGHLPDGISIPQIMSAALRSG